MQITQTDPILDNLQIINNNILDIFNIMYQAGILDDVYSVSEIDDIQNSLDTLQNRTYELIQAMRTLYTYEVDMQDGLRYPPIRKAHVAHNALEKSHESKKLVIDHADNILSLYLEVSSKLIICKQLI